MLTYWQLLLLILPVFATIAIGVVVRRVHWVEGVAEASLIKIVINLFMPCLIFESVVGNDALQAPGNILLPPLVGFIVSASTMGAAYYFAKWGGLTTGTGRRTFGLSAGLPNYGYLALPIITGMFGIQSRGVLLVHNIGVEMAVWTVGVLMLSGWSLHEAKRRILSPMVCTLLVAVAINLSGLSPAVPRPLLDLVHTLAVCAVPLGLLMTGINLANFIGEWRSLFEPRVTLGAMLLRLGIFPLVFLALARWLPCAVELKRVLIVQGAMPAAVVPIIIAQHFGGKPIIAVQVVLGTTALSVLVTPFWLRFGLGWAGL
jgi:predicted permease